MNSSNDFIIRLESLRQEIIESIYDLFCFQCIIFQFNQKLPIKVKYDGEYIEEDLLGVEYDNILTYGAEEKYDSMNIDEGDRYSFNNLSIEQLMWVLNEIENENGTWYSA